jgi:hypothetical protein
MQVTNWEIDEQGDTVEVSAEVDGFRLWYRLPRSYQVTRTGDPFLAAALLPAMIKGEPLELDPSLSASPQLLKNLSVLQEIHHCWNPTLKLIPIHAKTSSAEALNKGVLSFFSGGVDSTYTFLKHLGEISHLAFIQGFDFFAGRGGEDSPFAVADISDLAQIAYKLDVAKDAVSAFLKRMLSGATLASLSKYRKSMLDAGALEETLAMDLRKIVVGQSIYQEQRFAGVRLRPETRQLVENPPGGANLHKLNRLLLEDAYPLEIARKSSLIYETAIRRNAGFAQSFGKTLIPVATNHFPFGYRYNLSRNLSQGGALASIALLLGFPRVFVPSSYSYNQLFPLGSHPLTDPLWANEGMEIVHDGSEARRVDKIQKITDDIQALANLRVCFNDMNVNCGKCLKCLRTMIPLRLLHAGTGPFPPLPSNKVIKRTRIAGAIEESFFRDNLDLALQSEDSQLRNALRSCLRRHERMELVKDFDRVVLGGLVKRAYRKRGRATLMFDRIDTTPPQE